jgi:uncharacterized protein (DUF697 family)
VDEGAAAGHQVTWYNKGLFRVSFADVDEGWQALTGAILDSAEERNVVLARFYPALRDTAAQRLIKQAARQNAAIGAAFFIPGTDMPLMTVNQIRMVLNLAVMYGEELSQERAVEILGVIGAGLGFRAVARQFVTVVPGPGWAYKGAMGYSGTIALGHAAIRYFKEGAPGAPSHLAELAERLRSGAGGAGADKLKGTAQRVAERVDAEGMGEKIGSVVKRLRR